MQQTMNETKARLQCPKMTLKGYMTDFTIGDFRIKQTPKGQQSPNNMHTRKIPESYVIETNETT